MSGQSFQNKKGLSEMVGYAILVVIAIGLSILVYSYLKNYVPRGEIDCKDGISLMVKEISCTKGQYTISDTSISPFYGISLDLYNNGRFTLDGAFIRFGELDSRIKTTINDLDTMPSNINSHIDPSDYKISSSDFSFGLSPSTQKDTIFLPLVGYPDNTLSGAESLVLSSGDYEIEIQPFKISGNNILACKNIIKYPVYCS